MLITDLLVFIGSALALLFIGYVVGHIDGERYAQRRYFNAKLHRQSEYMPPPQTFDPGPLKGDPNPWPTKKS